MQSERAWRPSCVALSDAAFAGLTAIGVIRRCVIRRWRGNDECPLSPQTADLQRTPAGRFPESALCVFEQTSSADTETQDVVQAWSLTSLHEKLIKIKRIVT